MSQNKSKKQKIIGLEDRWQQKLKQVKNKSEERRTLWL